MWEFEYIPPKRTNSAEFPKNFNYHPTLNSTHSEHSSSTLSVPPTPEFPLTRLGATNNRPSLPHPSSLAFHTTPPHQLHSGKYGSITEKRATTWPSTRSQQNHAHATTEEAQLPIGHRSPADHSHSLVTTPSNCDARPPATPPATTAGSIRAYASALTSLPSVLLTVCCGLLERTDEHALSLNSEGRKGGAQRCRGNRDGPI